MWHIHCFLTHTEFRHNWGFSDKHKSDTDSHKRIIYVIFLLLVISSIRNFHRSLHTKFQQILGLLVTHILPLTLINAIFPSFVLLLVPFHIKHIHFPLHTKFQQILGILDKHVFTWSLSLQAATLMDWVRLTRNNSWKNGVLLYFVASW